MLCCVVFCHVVLCVVWCGVVWCGVVWCGLIIKFSVILMNSLYESWQHGDSYMSHTLLSIFRIFLDTSLLISTKCPCQFSDSSLFRPSRFCKTHIIISSITLNSITYSSALSLPTPHLSYFDPLFHLYRGNGEFCSAS